MAEDRFDIHWHEHGPKIDYHFCREIGCYGTDPEHGYTLDEVISEIALWHENQALAFRNKTHYEIKYFLENADG